MNNTEIERFLRTVAIEIDNESALVHSFRKDIIGILVFAFLWYGMLIVYIEHCVDKRIRKIEEHLENRYTVLADGYEKLADNL